MLRKAVLFAVVGSIIHLILWYRVWLDWDKKFLYTKAPGPCMNVANAGGSEDIMYLGNGHFVITSEFDFQREIGKIKILDLKSNRMTDANLTNTPDRADFLAAPHGMTKWTDPSTGRITVYVITHPWKEDRIEVFEYMPPVTLHYIKTITDPSFRYMNDLVAVDKDKFYLTEFWYFREQFKVAVESLLCLRHKRILFYDGKKVREVAKGYCMPNGINISPDKRTVYMAEFGTKRLVGFHRDTSNNDLSQLWAVDMNTGVDNIEVDQDTGDLWIGCHPIFWKINDFLKIFTKVLPSQVLRVKMRDNMVREIEEVYANDGEETSGSTVAVYAEGTLVIGTFTEQTTVCEVKYLTK